MSAQPVPPRAGSGASIELAGQGGERIRGWFVPAEPRHGPRAPGIVLVHEVFGLDPHIEDVARRFAREGFAVLAPDLWSREGLPGPRPTADDPAPRWTSEQVRAAVQSLPDRRVLGDLEGALAWLAARPDVDAERLAAVGFCMGGNHAYQLGCTSRRVRCVVDYYGRLRYHELNAAKPIQPDELALNLSVPMLAVFGLRDATIPREQIDEFRARLDQAAKHVELELYPEAGHGFFNDARPAYREADARDAWRKTLAFLRRELDLEDRDAG
jgi:carboxymethylenebutenolidase